MSVRIRALLAALIVVAVAAASALFIGYRTGILAGQSGIDVATTGDVRDLFMDTNATGSQMAGLTCAIGLVHTGVPWDDVQDHIKIAHHPILVLPEGSTQYAGAYWTGTQMAVTDDLGSDQEQAICEFREFLRERGET